MWKPVWIVRSRGLVQFNALSMHENAVPLYSTGITYGARNPSCRVNGVKKGGFTPDVCRCDSAGKERAKKERKTPPLRRASAQKQIAGYCPALWVDWCRDHRLELTKRHSRIHYYSVSRYVQRKENRQTLAGAPNLKGLEFGIPWKPARQLV